MEDDNEIALYKKLDGLRREHRTIEHQMNATLKQTPYDEFSISRYKKEKLAIRDQITNLENTLYPDIIA